MTILRWIKKTSLLGASLAIFVWSSSAGTLAFAGDPAASFQNPEITPVLSADVPSGRGLPSVLVTDPNDFLHPQALSVSSSPKTVPADQKLTTPEKDAVENQFNGLILNLIPIQIGTGGQDLDNRIFPDPGGTSAQNQ